MAVQPLPCDDGGGSGPPPTPVCCAPAIAAQPLCLPDGAAVLLVVRSGCVECGATPADPQAIGWINPQTGVFTPGVVPAGAGPCDGGCSTVTTVQLCDLLPGGGCTPFLRHLVRDCAGAVTTTLDTALDGTTIYPVSGTAGNCAACAAGCVDTICVQRCDDTDGDGQPDATYSELWCVRADGSAELVLTYADEPAVPYVPVSPMECTYGCPESQTLMLCDGSGPFLRRYVFLNGAASYTDVALDGQTPHVVMGQVGPCPAGPDCDNPTTPAATVGLCLPDGTPIATIITRDCSGTVTQAGWINLATGLYSAGAPPVGVTACGESRSITTAGVFCDIDSTGEVVGLVLVEYSYNPDGSIASVRLVDATTGGTYTPAGTVTACPVGAEQPEQDLAVLCDTQPDGTVTAFLRDWRRDEIGQVVGHTDYALGGGPYTPTGSVGVCQPEPEPPCTSTHTLTLCDVAADGTSTPFLRRLTLDCTGTVTASADTTLDGVTPYAPAGTVGVCQPEPDAPCSTAHILTLCDVAADGTSVPFLRRVTIGCDGTVNSVTDTGMDGATVYSPTGSVGVCQPEPDTPCETAQVIALCDVAPDGSSTAFLRRVTIGCDGTVIATADTGMDGVTPYAPAGTVGVCQPPAEEPEPCRNTSTLLVCDLPDGGAPDPAVTDTDPTPYYPYPTGFAVAGGQTLWDGGTLNLPPGTAPQPGTTGSVNSLAATIAALRPACDTGTAHVTVSVNAQQTGPDNGCGPTGHLRLFIGTTQAALTVLPANTPVGWFGTLTVEADVPAVDLAAGNVVVALALDAYDDSPATCTPSPRRTGWQVSAFTASVTYDQSGCATQFLRNVTTDCETGAVVAVVDTTMDGAPYTVTGTAGQCEAAGGACCPPPEPECPQHLLHECRWDDTDGDGLGDTTYLELIQVDGCTGALTSLGTYLPDLTAAYTPVAPTAECPVEGAPQASAVRARRVQLGPGGGGAWSAARVPLLQSVTATAHGGTGRISTVDGDTTLFPGESVTWSVARDEDSMLVGPLTITAQTGTVTISYTQGVLL
ncbi:hypothetical protein F5972_08170 [Microbispora cellulosiformans]|uniref:Uncharacterized protein n=1 Tax=Microbispora cellulosiformans TaxID=2614688 RepID=A0A5J5K576_9ACTN|nr:hypothetical protein [Microbispora cellulosiformans]KAA9379622.1 hypothetical protein F5972_08170 [Microbispora cellulosiformans]